MWQWVYLCHSRLGGNVRNEHVFGSSTHLLNKGQEAFLSSPPKKSLPCPICHSSMQRSSSRKKKTGWLCCVPLRAQKSIISTISTYYVPICDSGLCYRGKFPHIYSTLSPGSEKAGEPRAVQTSETPLRHVFPGNKVRRANRKMRSNRAAAYGRRRKR